MLTLHALLFAQAAECEQGGDLATAEQLYRRCLDEQPGDPQALLRLGLLLHRRGQPAAGLDFLRAAAAAEPAEAGRLGLFAAALARHGQPGRATEALRRCLAIDPASGDAQLALGNALQDLGEHGGAATAYRRAVAAAPGSAEAHFQLAGELAMGADLAAAAAHYRLAAGLAPDWAKTWCNIGHLLDRQGRGEAAAAACRRAAELAPDGSRAYAGLGAALLNRKRPAEAAAACRRALILDPADGKTAQNLALALQQLGRDDEAAAQYRRSIALDPASAGAYANFGVALYQLGHGNQAIAACRRGLRLCAPDAADQDKRALAHRNLALALLADGALAEGFAEFEWRWDAPDFPSPRSHQDHPRWDGGSFAGRTLLVHAEQGFGDTIQMCRYLPRVAALGGTVVVECPAPMAGLLRRLRDAAPPTVQVVAQDQALPGFDLQIPMMSLPQVFGTRLDTIPAAVPYLAADPQRLAAWRQAVGGGDKLKIGLVWAGSRDHPNDRRRSMALRALAALRWPAGTALYSLQKGEAEGELAAWTGAVPIAGLGEAIGDFADLAAAIDLLDLLITVDSAPAHVAGALARPVWTLLPFAADWRWLRDRQDSPWYPTMRLFRQRRPGDWDGVAAQLEAELTAFAGQRVCRQAGAAEPSPC